MDLQNLKGKKLLILAGAGVHNKVVRAAKEMGVYTIVVDYLEDSPAKKIADESWLYNIFDVDKIVERCKEVGVDGVLNVCIDPAQLPYLQICEKLGLPCYGTKEEFNILTDKRRFKDYCIAHDVDVIPDYTETDIKEDKADYPVFIKPTDSRGSRGQSICHNKEEALKGFGFAKAESSCGEVICEKYMGNYQDIGSAFFVVDGEPYLVKFGDRHLGKIEDNLNNQVICTLLPSASSQMFEKHVIERVKGMIKAMGVKFGPVFLQGFIDGNTIRYYDPARRMPGGDYDLILKEATGFDTVRTMIHFALTGDTSVKYGNPQKAYALNGGMAALLTVSVRPGLMASVSGMDELLKHKNIYYARQIIEEGSVIPASGDIKQRVAAVGIYAEDKKELVDIIDYVYSTYKVLDTDGNNMIVSKFECK